MSRSRRKTPILGNTAAASDHPWKQAAARKVRRCVKQALLLTLDGDRFKGRCRELINPASSGKDGKSYYRHPDPRWLRK